jgi:hypothetical protein
MGNHDSYSDSRSKPALIRQLQPCQSRLSTSLEHRQEVALDQHRIGQLVHEGMSRGP